MNRIIPPLAVLLACAALPASGKDASSPQEDPWFALVPGRFAVVGRHPDNGAAYAGTATISTQGKSFRLTRTVGARTTTATGTIEVPHPPGEGQVLRFRWQNGQPRVMSCLVHSDLDNYARLTCVWRVEGATHDTPGLEAYFSTETWPEKDRK